MHLLSIVCLAGLMATSACNEDEEPKISANGFTINDTFYPTDFGYIQPRKSGETILFYELVLSSERLDISDPDFLEADFNSLDVVALVLVPNMVATIPTGKIVYANINNPTLIDPKFFASAGINLNMNEENGVLFDIVDGVMNVAIDNKTYDISFELVTSDGEMLNGNFKGEIIEG